MKVFLLVLMAAWAWGQGGAAPTGGVDTVGLGALPRWASRPIAECETRQESTDRETCLVGLADRFYTQAAERWQQYWQAVPVEYRNAIVGVCTRSELHNTLEVYRCIHDTTQRLTQSTTPAVARAARRALLPARNLVNNISAAASAAAHCMLQRAGGNQQKARTLPGGASCHPPGNLFLDREPSAIAYVRPGHDIVERTEGTSELGSPTASSGGTALEGDDSSGDGQCDEIVNRENYETTACANARAAGLSMEPFAVEIRALYSHLSKQDYFELLRLRLAQLQVEALLQSRAIAQGCNAATSYTVPSACTARMPSLQAYVNTVGAQVRTQCAATREAEIRSAHQALAVDRQIARCRVGVLETLDQRCLHHGQAVPETPWPSYCPSHFIHRLSDHRRLLERSLTGHYVTRIAADGCPPREEIEAARSAFQQFGLDNPVFGTGESSALARVLLDQRSTPAQEMASIRSAHGTLFRSAATQLTNLCSDSYPVENLVRVRPLAESVLASAPEFRLVDQCFMRHHEATSAIGSVFQGCAMVALVPTPPTFALGAFCMLGELGATSAELAATRDLGRILDGMRQTLGSRALTAAELADLQRIQGLVADIRDQATNLALIGVMEAVARGPELLAEIRQRLERSRNIAEELRRLNQEIELLGPAREGELASSAAEEGGAITAADETVAAQRGFNEYWVTDEGQAASRAWDGRFGSCAVH